MIFQSYNFQIFFRYRAYKYKNRRNTKRIEGVKLLFILTMSLSLVCKF